MKNRIRKTKEGMKVAEHPLVRCTQESYWKLIRYRILISPSSGNKSQSKTTVLLLLIYNLNYFKIKLSKNSGLVIGWILSLTALRTNSFKMMYFID